MAVAPAEPDRLELAAAEWYCLRAAGAPITPAMRVVGRALAAAYVKRSPNPARASRVVAEYLA